MERIYRKRMKNTTLIFLFFCTTIGWWGILRTLHEVLNKSKLLKGAWRLPPYLKTYCVFFIATRNIPSIKNTSGFRGFILGLAVRLNNYRLGVITIRSAHSGDWVFGQRSGANALLLCGYFT
jgi:hypothetical protein